MTFAVRPFNDFIRDPYAVCGERKAEVLVLFFLNASGIGDQLFADLKVHERLSAKKVHFQIPSKSRILNQEIERTLSGLKAHKPR